MDVTKQIQIAIAQADLIVCTTMRVLALLAMFTIILLAVVLVVHLARPDPYLIDYDAPGVDITSEGPDDDFTDAYFELRGDEYADSNADL